MKKTQAIIPMAGQGVRLRSRQLKPLILLRGKPLFVHTLKPFIQSRLIDSLILVVPEKSKAIFECLVRKYRLSKVKKIISGGATRCESVFHGLIATDESTDIVVIHDGARPLVTREILEAAVKECYHARAIVVGVPVKSTIKKVASKNLFIEETLVRDTLWEIQTPQVFRKDILLRAHQNKKMTNPSDDALLVEQMGVKIKVVRGDYKNIKVTTPEDLLAAKAFLEF